MSTFFSKTAALVAYRTLKIAESSGGALKNFVSDVRKDMDTLKFLEKYPPQTEEELQRIEDEWYEAQMEHCANRGYYPPSEGER